MSPESFEITPKDIRQAFVNLVGFLKQNHTIHNPSASPKLDDYRAYLGRSGSVSEALAKACGLDFHTFEAVADGGNTSGGVFVDRAYLEALLEESNNDNLVAAIRCELGLTQ